jgi:hypothetical protein
MVGRIGPVDEAASVIAAVGENTCGLAGLNQAADRAPSVRALFVGSSVADLPFWPENARQKSQTDVTLA